MQPRCQAEEANALLQFKESLVIHSIRYNPYLTGYLPEFHWGSHLELLLLAGTSFSSQLPESIGNLKSLKEFDVANCYFSGVIPSSLGNLTTLNYLDLSHNTFSGKIPSTFVNLLQLTYLSLSSNNFSSGTLHWLCNLTKLTFVGLNRTNSYGEIPSCLGNLTQLTHLNLNVNELTGQIPSWMGNQTKLILLGLGDNKLHGPISDSIFRLPNLETLNLVGNLFSGTVELGHLKSRSLVSFQLSDNNLSVIGNHNDSAALQKIQILSLSGCNLSGEFPSFLHGQNHLEFVELGGNKIEGHIPTWFMNLGTETLWNLDLRGNLLTGFEQSVDILPWNNLRSDFEFQRLQIVDLSGNCFLGKLPLEYFRNWTAMKTIYKEHPLYMQVDASFQLPRYVMTSQFDYSMTMTNKGVVTKYEKIQEFLTAIDLSSNRFEGGIPDALGDLKELYSLNLSNNFLTGRIPPSLSNLKGLEALDLSQNKLSGEIPIQLAQLTFLEVFNVSHNLLSGPIPRGNQFETFDNTSFDANPGLCGKPLSKKCGNGEDSLPAPKEDEGSGYPLEFGWKVVVIGYATGLVIGAILGCAMNTRNYEWLVKNYFVNKGQNLKTRLCRN
ncbi:hypothetical protein POTOM_053030 [Populus tomentosa]|uniref:Receptor-like protein 12 n=1 Tax=Populus tomentosa TaxID=118781 RepID=A0A8X7Y4M3_POPTO|nr:hypothetical protein POTOM_053030 [Populus tomentosa]